VKGISHTGLECNEMACSYLKVFNEDNKMLKFLEKVMKQTSSTGILYYFYFFKEDAQRLRRLTNAETIE
jgi:hypothetical protein